MTDNSFFDGMTHAAGKHTELAKLKKSNRNEAVQRARATRAVKASAVLQKVKKKAMTNKDRLTTRCDESTHENQYISGLAKDAMESREIEVEV